ncbi:MFS transporter [Micromonospora sp. CPCC 205371]|nr:MFS transporter [Micromonospora sp. CPCC 205371]
MTAAIEQTRPAEAGTRRDFRRYLVGNGMSTFGTMFTGVATSALAVEAFGVTGVEAGMLRTAGMLPVLVIAPIAGVLADRVAHPRRLLIGAELAAAAAVGLFVLALLGGLANFVLLLLLTAVLGATTTLASSVFFTHLNSLRAHDLANARAQLQTTDSLVGLGATATAGPLIATFGPVVALVTDAFSYLFSAATLRSIGAPDHNPARDPSAGTGAVRRDIVEGVRVLLRSRIRPVIWYMLLSQAAFTGIAALKAIFLLRTLDVPLYLYGVPGFCAMAFGALGTIVASRTVSAGWSAGRATVAWWVGSALALLLLPVSAGSLPVALTTASVSLSLVALCGSAGNITLVALFSETIPERAMGRVHSTLMVLSTLATIVGAPLAGVLADLFGIRAALWVCAAVGVAGLPLLRPWWRARTDAG